MLILKIVDAYASTWFGGFYIWLIYIMLIYSCWGPRSGGSEDGGSPFYGWFTMEHPYSHGWFGVAPFSYKPPCNDQVMTNDTGQQKRVRGRQLTTGFLFAIKWKWVSSINKPCPLRLWTPASARPALHCPMYWPPLAQQKHPLPCFWSRR
jgi:hypothetical protein